MCVRASISFWFLSLYFSLNFSPMDTQWFCSLLFSFMNSLHSILKTFLNIQPSQFSRKQGVCVCGRARAFGVFQPFSSVFFSFLLLAVSGTVCRAIEGSAYICKRSWVTVIPFLFSCLQRPLECTDAYTRCQDETQSQRLGRNLSNYRAYRVYNEE